MDEVNNMEDRPTEPVTFNKVLSEIQNLNAKKATGYNLKTGRIFNELPYKGIRKLTHLFNASLRLQYVPMQWKIAQMIMIHKPGKFLSENSSYRPTSLLPVLTKLFEKLVLKCLKPIIEDKQLIPIHQFGFCKKHSTIEQVQRIIDVTE